MILREKETNRINQKPLSNKLFGVTQSLHVHDSLELLQNREEGFSDAENLGIYVHKFLELNIPNIWSSNTSFEAQIKAFSGHYPYPLAGNLVAKAEKIILNGLKNDSFRNLFSPGAAIYREQEMIFIHENPTDLFSLNTSNFAGIIDLLLVNGNKAILVDYKTGEYLPVYEKQIELYASGVRKCFPAVIYLEKYIYHLSDDFIKTKLIRL
jgi:ATP-dependent exoDNAse (exonuclease V) beta subunit